MSHSDWCRWLFDSLEEGGVWAMPRSGLLFGRRGGRLVLAGRMPHNDRMPITAVELADLQERDLLAVQEEFGKAGIDVVREPA